MTEPGWDDARLDAAFREKFDRPAPTSFEEDVHVRIAGTSPARFGTLRMSRGWSVAAAAVVVVLVVGTAVVGLGGLGRSADAPQPSGASASTPGPSATPTEQAVPGSIFGLPIIHVPDAIAIRDSGVDDREVAVQGWFTDGWTPACPAPTVSPVSPLQEWCPDGFVWLMEQPESLIHRSGNATSITGPSGPALNPDVDGIDRSWEQTDSGLDANGDPTPVDVVFVGHFDDRRAELCPRAEIDACRDRFVVDSVAIVHGVQQPTSMVRQVQAATSTVADIEAIIANEAPQSPILSMTVVDGATGLAAVEPSLGTAQEGLIDQATLWIVRVLESERISTYVIIDGSDAIYEMNPEGQAILVGGTPPSSAVSPSAEPWPPAGARVIALTSEVAAGAPPVRVAVIDESGRLGGVAEKGTVHPSTRTLDQPIEAYPELEVSPGRIHLAWVGSICDSRITVTVTADVGTITFDMGPQVECDSIGIERELVLDFSGLLNVPAINLVNATTGAAPPSATGGPGYALDCGPVARDACEPRAAGIVAANPTKRVVSIRITDECGSYDVTFADGTGSAAMIDCILPQGPSPQASGAS